MIREVREDVLIHGSEQPSGSTGHISTDVNVLSATAIASKLCHGFLDYRQRWRRYRSSTASASLMEGAANLAEWFQNVGCHVPRETSWADRDDK
eukprot:COSAG02_NODE_2550_length_8554_cov_67.309639_14_plen_94_part_00